MRTLALGLLAAAILGCGQQVTLVTGSVTGTVSATPCRPVERVGDPPCPPVPNVAIDFTDSGAHTFSATTDSTGTYLVSLAPGAYSIRVRSGFRSQPDRVTVAAGHTVSLNLTFDSGIR